VRTTQHNGNLREKHIGELIAQLGADTSTLVRQELALARAELTERVEVIRAELSEAAELARTETGSKLDQAKADVAAKGKSAGAGIGMFGAAGAATLLSLGALTAAAVLVLDRWLATDLAAAIVGIAWALIAATAALRGRDKVHEAGGLNPADYVPRQTLALVKEDLRSAGDVKELMPEQTIETVKEDVEWAKHPTQSAGR
jgi:hypothetical protein